MIQNKSIFRNSINNSNPENNIDVAIWIRFIRELGLQKMFGQIPDPRQKVKISYPLA